jgi:type IV pilus assembly protein PilA
MKIIQELMGILFGNGYGWRGDICRLLFIVMCFFPICSFPYFSMSDQENKSKESEAKQYVGSINRTQKAIFSGEKSAFATSVDALGIGIKTETKNYKYSVHVTKQAAFNYGVSKRADIRSYVGGVFLIPVEGNAAKNEIRTDAILCRADNPGTFSPLRPILQSGKLVCGYGTAIVKE